MSREAWLQRIKAPERPSQSIDDWLLDQELQACAKQNGSGGVAPERFCNCVELVIDGQRLPCPKFHDCSYTAERSKLVPLAVAQADAILPDNGKGTWRYGDNWTRRFVAEMEKLAAPLLKQSGNGSAREQKAI